MTEETESVRGDTRSREVNEKQTKDWSGKRFILPRGSSFPSPGSPGELFVLSRGSAEDQLYMWQHNEGRFATVGPLT